MLLEEIDKRGRIAKANKNSGKLNKGGLMKLYLLHADVVCMTFSISKFLLIMENIKLII